MMPIVEPSLFSSMAVKEDNIRTEKLDSCYIGSYGDLTLLENRARYGKLNF